MTKKNKREVLNVPKEFRGSFAKISNRVRKKLGEPVILPKKKRRKRAKKQAPNAALVEPHIRLGLHSFYTLEEQMSFARLVAATLKRVIAEKGWIQPYEDKEYVRLEGWTMLGSLLGVTPIEDYVKEIRVSDEDHIVRGYEAKVNLLCKGEIVGGASSECTIGEALWAGRDTYALRSMTLTRATSKAFRLSYGWIMDLAGYEAMPADELPNPEKKVLLEPKAQEMTMGNSRPQPMMTIAKVFGVWPPEHNGNKFFIFSPAGSELVDKGTLGIEAHLQQEFKAVFSDKFHSRGGWLIESKHYDAVKLYLHSKMIPAQIPQYAQTVGK